MFIERMMQMRAAGNIGEAQAVGIVHLKKDITYHFNTITWEGETGTVGKKS